MEEEFQESEVIFLDHHHDQHTQNYPEMIVTSFVNSQFVHSSSDNQKSKRKKKKMKNSAPVNISGGVFRFADSDELEEDEYFDDDDGEFVPPHVILGRRIAGQMAFSVHTGNGRTLKGRDLSQVRNSILKLTGFLET